MSFHHLDQFARTDSVVTRRPPTVRVLATVLLAVGAAVLPLGAWPQMIALGFLVVGLAALARIRPGAFLVRLAPPLSFVLLVSVAVLVLAPGEIVARLGPLRISDAGLLRFGSAAGRGAIALGAAVVLVSTTSFPEIVGALRRLRLPELVTASLSLAYRYIYILNDEVSRLRRAAASRNAAAGAAPRRSLMVGMASAALQRSFIRSERVHQAMLSRGYRGELPVLAGTSYSGRPAVEMGGLLLVVAAIVASAAL